MNTSLLEDYNEKVKIIKENVNFKNDEQKIKFEYAINYLVEAYEYSQKLIELQNKQLDEIIKMVNNLGSSCEDLACFSSSEDSLNTKY